MVCCCTKLHNYGYFIRIFCMKFEGTMTLDQLRMFVAVAEREHLTAAAKAVNRTPSAVSAAIRALEEQHGIALFDRVGRGIALTGAGRLFLPEAKTVLASAEKARHLLADLAGLHRGSIDVHASQTIASYWIPAHLMAFHAAHPAIDLRLHIGNTAMVAAAVANGEAEIGFVEGEVTDDRLVIEPVATDALVVVVGADHPWADGRALSRDDLVNGTSWVLREEGSGTRSEVRAALAAERISLTDLRIAMELPSNEAVLSAASSGRCATALSRAAAAPLIAQGRLCVAGLTLPTRSFLMLTHKERHPGLAGEAFARMVREAVASG